MFKRNYGRPTSTKPTLGQGISLHRKKRDKRGRAMTDQQKRTGRPPKAPTPGKRMSLGLKVTAEIKDRLDRAVRASGRTQSQEAEARLDREELLPELLELTHGREVAGLLLALGKAMTLAGQMAELQRFYPTATISPYDIRTTIARVA